MKINTNRILELTLVFFISLFSFAIGAYIGKKYSDNQHKLAKLEPQKENQTAEAHANAHESTQTEAHATSPEEGHGETAEQATQHSNENTHGENGDTAHHSEAPTKTDPNAKMTDEEVARIAAEFSDEESHSTAKPVKNSTHEKANKAPVSPQIKGAHNEKEIKTISKNADERDIASIPSTTATGPYFTVQVGSYPSEMEAGKMSESLLARGYKTNTVPALVNGKTMFRVQVGSFKSLTEAQSYKKEVMEKNRLTSAFVQRVD